jgi:hypothetical protein
MTRATERAPQPAETAEELQVLASDFEAALQAYHVFFHGGGTDDEAAAATDAVKAVAQKIIAVPGTDISIMRLKARVYLWAESTNLKKLAAEGGDWPSEAVLASLFRHLGVADLDATPGPATMADRAPAQHEECRSTEAPATEEPELQALIAVWYETSRRLEETYEASRAAADRAKQAEQKAAQERERVAEAKAVWGKGSRRVSRNGCARRKAASNDNGWRHRQASRCWASRHGRRVRGRCSLRCSCRRSTRCPSSCAEERGGAHMNAENNAVAPRRCGQEILKEMLLAERHELASTLLIARRREEIAACDRLLERLARLMESLH